MERVSAFFARSVNVIWVGGESNGRERVSDRAALGRKSERRTNRECHRVLLRGGLVFFFFGWGGGGGGGGDVRCIYIFF